ncbi:uncharacterized protein IL334_000771 [Kwoniella shivajii]|uniref:GH18 domain-containing protein n=1 Tax=Kwoniella shivajii TaxID=564305 RepID=A0ABZ1CT43_9TREE|nr:hypothetical protein IL334_000771 [Kwoniella shivajii]
MRSATYSAIVLLLGTARIHAAPAASPQSSDTTGTAAGVDYKCSEDGKSYTGLNGSGTGPCQGGTVCKEGVPGGPCVWPEGYGAPGVAAIATGAGSATAASATSEGTASGVSVGGVNTDPSGSATIASTGSATSSASASATDGSSSIPGEFAVQSVTGDASQTASGVSTSTASSSSVSSSSTDKSTSSSEAVNSGQTRFVGYWENFSNFGSVSNAQLDGLTHVILSFIDMLTWTPDNAKFAVSSNGNFNSTTADTLRAQKAGLKVSAALGGWGLDQTIRDAADAGDAAITALIANAKSVVKQYKLDGLDLDWEFPNAQQQPAFVKICQGLKKAIQEENPKGILSVALGSRTTQKDPKTSFKDVDAMTQDTFSQLADTVDMWNIMTYDYVNRYDTKTGHQSSKSVIEQALAYYKQNGMALDKANIGFLNTAKFFGDVTTCSTENPIDCTMGGVEAFETGGKDNGISGWLRYNPEIDAGLGEYKEQAVVMRTDSWAKKPDDSTTAFEDEHAHAWYDQSAKVFWTWTTGDDNKALCEEFKSQVGGMFVWSVNQDEHGINGGSHMQALASCVKG